MRKIALLATILNLSFLEAPNARMIDQVGFSMGIGDEIYGEVVSRDESAGPESALEGWTDPAELVVELDDMTPEEAHQRLSTSGYFPVELEEAFQVAHQLGKSKAVTHLSHELNGLCQGGDFRVLWGEFSDSSGKKRLPSQKNLGLSTRKEVKRYANVLKRWDLS